MNNSVYFGEYSNQDSSSLIEKVDDGLKNKIISLDGSLYRLSLQLSKRYNSSNIDIYLNKDELDDLMVSIIDASYDGEKMNIKYSNTITPMNKCYYRLYINSPYNHINFKSLLNILKCKLIFDLSVSKDNDEVAITGKIYCHFKFMSYKFSINRIGISENYINQLIPKLEDL